MLRTIALAFSYTDAVPVIREANLHLGRGWAGLVGENGSGKSTLLALLGGELAPTAGRIQLAPDTRVHLCHQDVEALDEDISRLGADPAAAPVRARLGLAPETLARWPTLSPGQRRRWQIGAALAAEPDVLMLDEPTNHLDAEGRDWLFAALRRHRGAGVVVSHDRTLLDTLTITTLRIDDGVVTSFPGAYSAARAAWEADAAARAAGRAELHAEKRRAQRRLDAAHRNEAGASRATYAGHRMRHRNDSDARSMALTGRAMAASKSAGKTVAREKRALERTVAALDGHRVKKELGRSVFIGYQPAPKPWLVRLEAEMLGPPGVAILRDVRAAVGRDARIHVTGDNGAGKSTLLGALAAAAHLPAERLLHLPQELTAAERVAAVVQVNRLHPTERGRVLSLVAALGVDPDRLLSSGSPSPGEARKLRLALGLGGHAHLLVLDEPTNHLDVPAIERLETALVAYPGALVLVTHDNRIALQTTHTTWRISGGRLHT